MAITCHDPSFSVNRTDGPRLIWELTRREPTIWWAFDARHGEENGEAALGCTVLCDWVARGGSGANQMPTRSVTTRVSAWPGGGAPHRQEPCIDL
jgi:hypothetical protein